MDSYRRFGLSLLACGLMVGCATSKPMPQACRTSRSLPSMGTFIQVELLHSCGREVSPDVFVKVQNRLDEIESQFSLYIQDSDLMRWNRGDRSFKPGHDFNYLFGVARNLKVKTMGYFDVTVLKHQGIPHTFDGIAKGYAVDETAKLLEAQNYSRYQINFSGNLKWSHEQGKGAAASSGNRHRPGHILNPKTLRANLEKNESLVQGESATLCDALSTAYFAAPSNERAQLRKEFSDYSFSMGD